MQYSLRRFPDESDICVVSGSSGIDDSPSQLIYQLGNEYMTIVASANYHIKARFFAVDISNPKEHIQEPTDYVDNFNNLRHAIAFSWQNIPHEVKVKGFTVDVFKKNSVHRLATFEFSILPSVKLPDHF